MKIKKLKEFLTIVALTAIIIIALFGSLIDARWLEPFC